MKFNCEKQLKRLKEKIYWHKWFAWFPVSLLNDSVIIKPRQCAWLEVVERRVSGSGSGGFALEKSWRWVPRDGWSYRAIKGDMK